MPNENSVTRYLYEVRVDKRVFVGPAKRFSFPDSDSLIELSGIKLAREETSQRHGQMSTY